MDHTHDGWFGLVSQVEFYLSVVGADKDADGKYLLKGEAPVVGMGGDEMVVPGGCSYLIDGHPKNLAAGLRSTSYGVGVKVF